MLLPVRQISSTLSRVMFPSFALIQSDKKLIWDQYGKMMSIVAVFSFPLMIILGVYARECVLVVYGYQWMDVVPLFRILCLLGAVQSIAAIAAPVIILQEKQLYYSGLAS
jgi:PST family polysaccharide transporter